MDNSLDHVLPWTRKERIGRAILFVVILVLVCISIVSVSQNIRFPEIILFVRFVLLGLLMLSLGMGYLAGKWFTVILCGLGGVAPFTELFENPTISDQAVGGVLLVCATVILVSPQVHAYFEYRDKSREYRRLQKKRKSEERRSMRRIQRK